jgi:hypothetical protein
MEGLGTHVFCTSAIRPVIVSRSFLGEFHTDTTTAMAKATRAANPKAKAIQISIPCKIEIDPLPSKLAN